MENNNSMLIDTEQQPGSLADNGGTRSCLLCELALNRQHEELAGIIQAFVADHITRTQVSKISQDVLQVLQENLPADVVGDTTEQDITQHVNTHTTHPSDQPTAPQPAGSAPADQLIASGRYFVHSDGTFAVPAGSGTLGTDSAPSTAPAQESPPLAFASDVLPLATSPVSQVSSTDPPP